MELVVGPNLLQLSVGIHQRLPVPQPDIVDGRLVGLERLEGEILFHREGFDRDLMEIVGLLGEVDVALDVGLLQLQLVGFDEHDLKQRGEHHSQHQGAAKDQHRPGYRKLPGADPQIGPTGKGCDDRKPDQQPEDGQCNMGIGVARPYHHAIVAVQQQIAVETIGPGLHREKEPQQRRAMGDGRG